MPDAVLLPGGLTIPRFDGQVVFVTGGASGIGRAVALAFGHEGAKVAVTDLDMAGASRTAGEITKAGGRAVGMRLDVTDDADWREQITQIAGKWGRLDILAACAGVSAAGTAVGTDPAEWKRIFSVNLDGVYYGLRHTVPEIARSGGGSVIAVASASGIRPTPGAAAYAASKAALIHLVRGTALECQKENNGVRVNAISPAGVKTAMWESMDFFRKLVADTGSVENAYRAMETAPGGTRFSEPEEIAAGILYLASPDARSITGTNLVIDNGHTACP